MTKTGIFQFATPPSLFSYPIDTKKKTPTDNLRTNLHFEGKESYATVFRIFVNLHHFLGLSPFKINNNTSPAVKFFTTKSKIIKCILVQSFVTLVMSVTLRADWKLIQGSVSDIVNTFATQIQTIVFFYFLWWKQKDFLKFLNLVSSSSLMWQRAEFKSVTFTLVFFLTSFMVLLYSNRSGYIKLLTDTNAQEEFLKWTFFINPATSPKGGSGLLMTSAMLLYVILDLCKTVLYGSIDGLIMIVGYVMVNLGKEFEAMIRGGEFNAMILEEFGKIKEIAICASETFGILIFYNYLSMITYYATYLKSIMSTGALLDKLAFLPFIMLNVVSWSYHADFHQRVSACMKSWIYKNKKELPISGEEVVVIVEDIYNNPVGLECTFFTITYGFLGSMMGLILTYAVIMFQLNSK